MKVEMFGNLMNARQLPRSLIKHLAYLSRLMAMPVVAFLPATLAYRLACLYGDWCYLRDGVKREMIKGNLLAVLGDRLTGTQRMRITRDRFRLRCCNIVDVMRLAWEGQALARLVEVRGGEHLEMALAQGKGAIVCTAHFGSFLAIPSLLLTDGFPVTMVGRLSPAVDEPCPPDTRRSWQRLVERRVASRSHRPVIQLKPERRYAAMQMANVLRANEAIVMAIDAPPLVADRQRAVSIEFLGQQVCLLSGCITLARLTGASILMAFLHRSPDWRHQVLEILPPLAMGSDMETTFEQCMATVETAILQQPAHWLYWDRTDDLVDLGLMPPTTS